MTDHRTSLDAALARTKPAGGEVPAVVDGAASPAGEGVEALAKALFAAIEWSGCAGSNWSRILDQHRWREYAETLMRSNWLAAHDAQVAAAAEKAAGERIAKVIEAVPVMGRSGYIDGRTIRAHAARIARADCGSDRG